jgi:hypothetical protein
MTIYPYIDTSDYYWLVCGVGGRSQVIHRNHKS